MNEFQQVIKAYLDQRAQEDAQFADNYAKKGKSIENAATTSCGRVVQSRGRFNKLTERHDDIVILCNNNAKTILAARQP